ncbi:hypothetical protein BJV82DRAFT_636161 [Fennellomyces sp. T-0311]|nr:hypothetical protein BJV82DRAFT_636161 [Fennellomyces sp. T-0311]
MVNYQRYKAASAAFLLHLISLAQADSVTARCAAGCEYLPPKIYCYGGREFFSNNGSYGFGLNTSLFNSLDLSQGSSLTDIQNHWTPIDQVTPGTNTLFAMAAVPEYNALFMDGGGGVDSLENYRSQFNNTIYDVETGAWSTDIPMRDLTVIFHTATLGPNSTVYVWGGRAMQANISQDPTSYPLDMYLFNFGTSSWSTTIGVQSLAETRVEHKAVLGGDGVSIYYIGGLYPTTPIYANLTDYYHNLAPMDRVLIFNTNTSQWQTRNTSGETPTTRRGHTLNLKPSTGELILFGGYNPLNTTLIRQDYFHLLDTTNMVWYTRSLSVGEGVTHNVSGIFDHCAVIVEHYMYIIFGVVAGQATSDIRALDIESWSWLASVPAIQPVEPTEPSDGSSGSSVGTIVGAVVGSVGGVAIVGGIIAFFYIRKRRRAKEQAVTKAAENDTEPSSNIKDDHDSVPLESPTSPGGFSKYSDGFVGKR